MSDILDGPTVTSEGKFAWYFAGELVDEYEVPAEWEYRIAEARRRGDDEEATRIMRERIQDFETKLMAIAFKDIL